MYREDGRVTLTACSAVNATCLVYHWPDQTTNTNEFVPLKRHEFVMVTDTCTATVCCTVASGMHCTTEATRFFVSSSLSGSTLPPDLLFTNGHIGQSLDNIFWLLASIHPLSNIVYIYIYIYIYRIVGSRNKLSFNSQPRNFLVTGHIPTFRARHFYSVESSLVLGRLLRETQNSWSRDLLTTPVEGLSA